MTEDEDEDNSCDSDCYNDSCNDFGDASDYDDDYWQCGCDCSNSWFFGAFSGFFPPRSQCNQPAKATTISALYVGLLGVKIKAR